MNVFSFRMMPVLAEGVVVFGPVAGEISSMNFACSRPSLMNNSCSRVWFTLGELHTCCSAPPDRSISIITSVVVDEKPCLSKTTVICSAVSSATYSVAAGVFGGSVRSEPGEIDW